MGPSRKLNSDVQLTELTLWQSPELPIGYFYEYKESASYPLQPPQTLICFSFNDHKNQISGYTSQLTMPMFFSLLFHISELFTVMFSLILGIMPNFSNYIKLTWHDLGCLNSPDSFLNPWWSNVNFKHRTEAGIRCKESGNCSYSVWTSGKVFIWFPIAKCNWSNLAEMKAEGTRGLL